MRARELAAFIDTASANYGFATDDLVAVGYSNGANIAAAMILLGIAQFPRAILFRAMVPLQSVEPPDLSGKQLLLSGGEHDPIAQADIVRSLADLFRRGNADVALIFQQAGHELTHQDVMTARRWLES